MGANFSDLPKTDRGWQAYLANIKSNGERRWLAMGGGLTICLEPGGSKTFQARLRRSGDKNARRINIGAFPAVSVAEARQRLAEARSIVKEGRNPAVAQRRQKARVEEVATLSGLIDTYIERRKEAGRRPKTLESETNVLKTLRKKLGDRLLADIEPRDIAAVVQAEAARLVKAGRTGRSANLMLGATKQMFKQARGWGIFSGQNPASELSRPAKEAARDRVLHDPIVHPNKDAPSLNEVGALLSAIRSSSGPLELEAGTRVAIYLSLALGLRVSEVAALEWVAVHLEGDIQTIEVRRAKTQAGMRTLPVPVQVIEVLRQLRQAGDKRRRFLFPARADAKRVEHIHPESLSRAFARTCETLKLREATFHDLRRTMITGLGELTGDDTLAKRIAGHQEKTILARHYDRSRRVKAMLRPLQLWADALDRMAAEFRQASPTSTLSQPTPIPKAGAIL